MTPGYFAALDVAPVRGRSFSQGEDGRAEAVINDAARRRFWPEGPVIGERIGLGPVGQFLEDLEVVGIVPELREGGLTNEPAPMVYFLYSAYPVWSDLSITLRTTAEPLGLARTATGIVHDLDASLPVYGTRTSRELVEDQVGPTRDLASLLAAFAGLGLVLAASEWVASWRTR